jgi:Mg-chelatase subunit ChlD
VGGATNLGDALLKAFEDKEVDTIFVLSDGMPNVGKLPSAEAILNEVARINAARRIVIHTINFTSSSDAKEVKDAAEFLKKLAEDNGGTYVNQAEEGKKEEQK